MKKLTANDIRIVARAAYDEAEESLQELEEADDLSMNSGKKRRMLLAHMMLEQADLLATADDLLEAARMAVFVFQSEESVAGDRMAAIEVLGKAIAKAGPVPADLASAF